MSDVMGREPAVGAEREGVAELEQHIEVLRELRDDYHLCGPTEYSEALSAAIRALRQGGEPVAWPERMANVPADDGSGDRIVGFRIPDGDPILGKYGLSEPLDWLRRVTVERTSAPPSPAKEG